MITEKTCCTVSIPVPTPQTRFELIVEAEDTPSITYEPSSSTLTITQINTRDSNPSYLVTSVDEITTFKINRFLPIVPPAPRAGPAEPAPIVFGIRCVRADAITSLHKTFQDLNECNTLQFEKYFDTSNCTNFDYMCAGMNILTNLDLRFLNTDLATSYNGTFAGCGFTNIDNMTPLINWDNVTEVNSMWNFNNITSVNLDNIKGTDFISMESFFSSNPLISLTGLINLPNVNDASFMLSATNFVDLSLSSHFIFSKTLNRIYGIFNQCHFLESLRFGVFPWDNINDITNGFKDCENLVCIDNLDTTTAAPLNNSGGMFDGCSALIAPDATNQSALITAPGIVWTNLNTCPGEIPPYVCEGPEDIHLEWVKYKIVVGDLGSGVYGVSSLGGSVVEVDTNMTGNRGFSYLTSNSVATEMQFTAWNYYYCYMYLDDVKTPPGYEAYHAGGGGYSTVNTPIWTAADVGKTFCVVVEHQPV